MAVKSDPPKKHKIPSHCDRMFTQPNGGIKMCHNKVRYVWTGCGGKKVYFCNECAHEMADKNSMEFNKIIFKSRKNDDAPRKRR